MQLISYVALSAVLFCIGLLAVLMKRNPVLRLFAIQLMLGAVSLNALAFARHGPSPNGDGQLLVLFLMMLMLAQAMAGVIMLLILFRRRSKHASE